MGLWRRRFQPRQQSWAKVETHPGVVILDLRHFLAVCQDARCTIRRVTLGGDPLVPIVIGIGRILYFDGFKPRILTWRLIKMAMNADVTHATFQLRGRRYLVS